MMIIDHSDFLLPKYISISFLSIGNAYFSFILLFSTCYELERLHNIPRMNFLNRTDKSHLLKLYSTGFP